MLPPVPQGDKRVALRDHLENLNGTPVVSLEKSKCQEAGCSSLESRGEGYPLGSNVRFRVFQNRGMTKVEAESNVNQVQG